MADLYGLTEAQVQRLRAAIEAIELSDDPSPRAGRRRPLYASRVIIGALTSSIAATTALLGKPKVGTLNVYSFSSTGVTDTGVDETVYSFAPQAATTDRWSVAERCNMTGKWILTTQYCS